MRRILVVDDNEADLRLAVDRLRDEGFDARGCTGAQDALGALERWSPDLVVMDIRMPGLDGYRLAREMHALTGHEALPIIAVTAYDPDPERATWSGVGSTLSKPVLWASLAAAIRARLQEVPS